MKFFVALATVAVLLGSSASVAGAEPAHQQPQGPAKMGFATDFPHLVDHEWGFALGGFGGVRRRAALHHVPVVFVHGNTVDAADWYVVRDDFRAAGWSDQELFGLSYNGMGSNNGFGVRRLQPERDQEHLAEGSNTVTITNNDVNVPDLTDFLAAVRDYTGTSKFVVVAHSLGVTLVRKTLKVHPELRRDLVAFVAIAGGNHGTSLCPPGSEDNLVSCNEIAAGTPWLADLNGPGGRDETYGAARWMTIYDGSGAGDPAYAGPTYAPSPQLRGALNRTYPGRYHNDLRIDADIVAAYRSFIHVAELPYLPLVLRSASGTTGARTSSPPAVAARGARSRRLPATGGTGASLASALALLALALMVHRSKRPHRP
jgi:pimeloyl-ACP methyl ester carboxylesterase